MARKTISQRIALVGGDEIRKQLSQFGQTGEQAFADVQKAAEKLTGPGAEFARSMDAAQKRIRELGESVKDVGRKMRDFGAGMSVAVTAPLVLMGKKSLEAWRVQEEAIQRVNAALRSTGGSVGFSSEQLQKMAAELQKVTTYGDEAILKMQAVLLTFTNVKGDQFKAANMAVLNLSAALGTDLQSAAIQVGKALNDPVAGLSALARSGIQFTAAQKETVKQLVETGKAAEAQDLILRELNVQFGGMSEELANSDFGRYQQAMNALGDSFEQVGKALTPVIARLADVTTKLAEFMLVAVQAFTSLPEWGQNAVLVFGVVVTAIGPALLALGAMTMGVGALVTGFAGLLPALVGVSGAIAALGGTLTAALGPALAFVGWPALLAAAIGALAVVVYRNWDGIVAYIAGAFEAISAAAEAFTSSFGEKWSSLWSALGAPVRLFKDAFFMVWDQIADHIKTKVEWIKNVVGSMIGWAKNKLNALRDAIESVIGGGDESGSGSSSGGGGDVMGPSTLFQGFAGGGGVRGPGTSTSDSILARLSDGEFVVKARAVRHYGADLFRRLNAMTFSGGSMLGGYASGGLVSGSTVPVGAGPGAADAMRPFNLSIGGESFGGLMAPRETAERLVRFALHEEAKSAGRRPAWFKGS